MALRVSFHNSGGELDHIITTPSPRRAKTETLKWLDENVVEFHVGDKIIVEDTARMGRDR